MPGSTPPSSDLDPYSHFLTSAASKPIPCPPLPQPNHAAVLIKPLDLHIHALQLPTHIPPRFVLLAIKALGICGSDVHYWQHGGIGAFKLTTPMVIGHECSGEVLAVGEAVTHLKAGARVAVEPGIACHHCRQCQTGRYNLCPDMQFFATPPVHGSLCRYILHPAELCFELPASLSYAHGAFCEPMSVGVMACNRAGLRPGQRVAIMGAGPIGLITLLVAKAYGAATALITDVSTTRLEKAKQIGADHTLCVDKLSVDECVDRCVELLGGPADIVFDCAGFSSTTNTAIRVTMNGGIVVAVGLGESEQKVRASEINMREVDIKGIFRYCHTYPTCLQLLASGKVNVDPLITHVLDVTGGTGGSGSKQNGVGGGGGGGSEWHMDESVVLDGFDIAKTGRDGAIKVMFTL